MSEKGQEFNNKIVVGMDGQLESTVVAYLLKKQGKQVVGMAVQLAEKETGYGFDSLHNGDLDKIKSICDSLEIPFFAADAKDYFKDRVLNKIVTAKISGISYEPLPERNKIIIETLLEKAKKVGADRIATGHYAKISLNQQSGLYSLHTANDDGNDETYGIAALTQDELSRMLLPLSEIRRIEVEKIGALLSIEIKKDENKDKRRSVMQDPKLYEFVEQEAAPSLRGEGSIMNYFEGSTLCDHDGIHRYHIGQSKLVGKEKFNVDQKLQVVKLSPGVNTIFVDHAGELKHTHVQLVNLIVDKALDITKPLNAYVKTCSDSEKKPCTIEFKNNDTCILTFKDEQEGICPEGKHFVVYNRLGLSAKVIVSGETKIAGYYRDGYLKTLPESKEEKEMLPSLKPEPKIERLKF